MARLQGRRLARLDEALAAYWRIGSSRRYAIAVAAVVGHHQRLVDQPRQEVGHLPLVDAFTGRDLLRALQRERPGEDGQASEERPLGARRAGRGSSSASP